MTDSQPDADSTSPKPRGLWSLMGGASAPAETPGSKEAAPNEGPASPDTSSVPPEETHEAEAKSPSPKRRGLWGLMRQAETEPSADESAPGTSDDADDEDIAAPIEPPEESARPRIRLPPSRSLFALMQRGESETEVESPEDSSSDEAVADDEVDSTADSFAQSDEGEESQSEHVEERDELEEEELVEPLPSAAPMMMEAIEPEDLEPSRYRIALLQARRQSRTGFLCGIASVAAASLAMLPEFWSGIPATVLGFAAIIGGYLALTGAARREISTSTRGTSLLSMLLGTLGIFLGPLLFANLGRSLREGTGQQLTQQHLEQIGVSIDRSYGQNDAYPIGGTFARDDSGVIRGQHGWMTFLLPFVGQDNLYHSIEMSKPYDDPVNRTAMGKDVVTYFAAGGDRNRIGQGFSVSHYAGVGGEIDDDRGLSHVGIFERDVAVKRDEITDGLSNTLIVGELAGTYPPWGDPENWRVIGRGLNRDVNGFGSAAGHGATFLLADGTVKFFSNKTDPKLLEQLSTRDGAE